MTDDERARYADAAASALNLPMSPAQRARVLPYLALAEGFAHTVQAVPLTAHDESALVFMPVVPGPRP